MKHDIIEQADESRSVARWAGSCLVSARRYVEAFARNGNNHPQALDSANELLRDIDAVLKKL